MIRIYFLLGLQGDVALGEDGLQVDQDGRDARHLLQETHHHRDEDGLVEDGGSELRACDPGLGADAVLQKNVNTSTEVAFYISLKRPLTCSPLKLTCEHWKHVIYLLYFHLCNPI